MSLPKVAGIVLVVIALYSGTTQAADDNVPKIYEDVSPSQARNVREEAKYRYMLANEYEDAMNDAEENDDVEKYEYNLEKMRAEDKKFNKLEHEYNEMRQNLETRIRGGEIIIEGFPIANTKGRFASIIDHITGKVKN